MAELICNCSNCNQPVAYDDAWAGQQLQCPSCQKLFVAPGTPPVETPPPPPPQQRPFRHETRGTSARSTGASRKPASSDSGGARKFAILAMVLVVLGAGGWVLFTYGGKWQKQFTEKTDKEAAESGPGGQVGHIGNLYEVLDATDPDKGLGELGSSSRPGRDEGPIRAEREMTSGEEKELPIIPAVWTLDPATAKIPESKVNGSISGGKFVCNSAHLEVVGNSVVLMLRQGEDLSPDREIFIYLRPTAGQKIAGGSWNVNKDMKGFTVPQVVKRWKLGPRLSPAMKTYASGYVMQLELGLIRDGEVKGKIFVALPDAEQSVAAGMFTAETSLPDSPIASATETAAAPK